MFTPIATQHTYKLYNIITVNNKHIYIVLYQCIKLKKNFLTSKPRPPPPPHHTTPSTALYPLPRLLQIGPVALAGDRSKMK